MNYISVLYCVLACVISFDWFSRGRLQYRYKFCEGSDTDYESEEALVRGLLGIYNFVQFC